MSNHTSTKSIDSTSGLTVSHYVVCPHRGDSEWGMTGDAFYTEVPVISLWFAYQEALDLIECYEV
jgi:hypothetical protein